MLNAELPDDLEDDDPGPLTTEGVDEYLTDLRQSLEIYRDEADGLLSTANGTTDEDEEDRRAIKLAKAAIMDALSHIVQIENARLSGFDHPAFDPPPAPLTVKEAATRLKAGESTVRKWCKEGLFSSAIRVGRDWVIPPTDLEGFTPPPMGRPKRAQATA